MGLNRKGGFKYLLPLLGLSVIAVGLFVSVNITKQPQNFKSSAASPDKLPLITSSPCQCTGATVCKNFNTQAKCTSNSKCTWKCQPTPTPYPRPKVITPNGGETWQRGSTYQITWSQDQKTASTALFVYTRGQSGDTYLGAIEYYVSNAVGTNSYSWTIPQLGSQLTTPPDGENIIISVAQYDSDGNRIVEDKSDSPFTVITPKPTMVTPNGGETWQRGGTYEITWNQAMKASSTALFLYTRNPSGDTYLGAIEYYVSNVVGTNSYSWTIPSLGDSRTTPPDGSNVIISVAQYDSRGNRIVEDKSDSSFTVITP